MKVERVRPRGLRLTLYAYELAALIAAARWAAENDELPTGSSEQLRQVLASYDEATYSADTPGAPRRVNRRGRSGHTGIKREPGYANPASLPKAVLHKERKSQ